MITAAAISATKSRAERDPVRPGTRDARQNSAPGRSRKGAADNRHGYQEVERAAIVEPRLKRERHGCGEEGRVHQRMPEGRGRPVDRPLLQNRCWSGEIRPVIKRI